MNHHHNVNNFNQQAVEEVAALVTIVPHVTMGLAGASVAIQEAVQAEVVKRVRAIGYARDAKTRTLRGVTNATDAKSRKLTMEEVVGVEVVEASKVEITIDRAVEDTAAVSSLYFPNF